MIDRAEFALRALPTLSVIGRLQQRGALLLLVLAAFGYPLAGLIVTFLGVDTQLVTIPYRGGIAAFSIIVILSGLFARFRGRLDTWFTLFLALYLFRLIYDLSVNSIIGNLEALQFYSAAVVLPLVAITLGGAVLHGDHIIGRWFVASGLVVTSLALVAQAFGLGYNPWADQGVTDVRLGFQALNPISLGFVASTTVLAALTVFASPHQSIRWRLVGGLALPVSGVLLIQAGSRGALLAIAISLAWFALTKIKRLVLFGPALTLILVFGISQTAVFQQTIDTISGGWATDAGSLVRLEAQAIAIEDFFEGPIFGAHYANPAVDVGNYPHNLIIETAMALGLIGLVLFGTSLLRATRNIFGWFNSAYPLLTLLFIQYVVASFLTGALWASDALFLYLMLVLTTGVQARHRAASLSHATR